MRTSLLLSLAILLILKTQGQTFGSHWAIYDTSSKIDVKKFSTLTPLEKEFVKSFSDFTNNRARLTLTDGGNRISPKELQQPDFPMPCTCTLNNDSIFITAALGMMSGLGLKITINKNRFASIFFQEADNTNIFKPEKSDTSYIDRISVPADVQKLTLFKNPSFLGNETIIGILNAKFKKFYELDFNTEPPLTRNYKAKLFFKCRLRSRSK